MIVNFADRHEVVRYIDGDPSRRVVVLSTGNLKKARRVDADPRTTERARELERQARAELQPTEISSVQDVRALRACRGCSRLGDGRNMIQVERGKAARHYHGRCYLASHGWTLFSQLEREQLDKLTLDDVGADVMKKMLEIRK